MINLENQVVSLNLARRLKELNVRQESLFVWHYESEKCHGVRYKPFSPAPNPVCEIFQFFSAFSVAELMEILPANIDTKTNEPFNNFYLHVDKRNSKNIQYIANYIGDSARFEDDARPLMVGRLFRPNSYSENLADALGNLLIRLIEDGLFIV